MRRNLGIPSLGLATLLTLGLAACAQDPNDSATDPSSETSQAGEPSTEASEPSEQPTDEPSPEIGDDGPVPFSQVAMLTNTEEGGTVSTTPVPLDSEAAVEEFASQFTGARMAEDIRAAVATAPEIDADQTLVGAVLVIGCDRPTALRVERVDGAVQVSPVMSKRQVQCFATMTSVAILVVDTVKLGPIVS
ncbi:hypothetical protein [Nocardioides sp. LHG3406-4]|uniref:hypothetical protein n=1 Tax=Nocardioides sp. LHG3406-4 TaxID=2804575 RepID=UPI003CF5B19A